MATPFLESTRSLPVCWEGSDAPALAPKIAQRAPELPHLLLPGREREPSHRHGTECKLIRQGLALRAQRERFRMLSAWRSAQNRLRVREYLVSL